MAYLPEKLGAMLNTGLSYARRKNEPQVQKCFDAAFKAIDEESGRVDASIIPVLDEYERLFREVGCGAEADRLAAVSKEIRAENPRLYAADGAEIPWFKRDDFVSTIPALPVEFRASHAEELSGCAFGIGMIVAFFAGALVLYPLSYIVPTPLPQPLRDISLYGYCVLILLGGVVAEVRRSREKRRNLAESWCRITEDAVEFHAPDAHHKFHWNEITKTYNVYDSGQGDDTTYDVLEVYAGTAMFRMSARFFTEQEVKLVHGICKLKSGV